MRMSLSKAELISSSEKPLCTMMSHHSGIASESIRVLMSSSARFTLHCFARRSVSERLCVLTNIALDTDHYWWWRSQNIEACRYIRQPFVLRRLWGSKYETRPLLNASLACRCSRRVLAWRRWYKYELVAQVPLCVLNVLRIPAAFLPISLYLSVGVCTIRCNMSTREREAWAVINRYYWTSSSPTTRSTSSLNCRPT